MIGAIPPDRLNRYRKNARLKNNVLINCADFLSDENLSANNQSILSWELAQMGVEVYQGGKYEKFTEVSSAFSGLDAPVDEAVILVKDFCCHHASEDQTMDYAEISDNYEFTNHLLRRAKKIGLVLPRV